MLPRSQRVHRGGVMLQRDGYRRREYLRLRSEGCDAMTAWRAVVVHPSWGFRGWRGAEAAAVPEARAARLLANFLRRVPAPAAEDARNEVTLFAAEFASRAWRNLEDLANGNFGTGRVVVRGRGDDATEDVAIDSAAAAVKLKANVAALQAVGVLQSSGRGVTVTAQAAADVDGSAAGVSVTFGDVLRGVRHARSGDA